MVFWPGEVHGLVSPRGHKELDMTEQASPHFRVLIFPVAQTVKNPPAMQEIQVRSLGREDRLETPMATHSSVLAWRVPWTEEPGGLWSRVLQRVRHDWATNTATTVMSQTPGLPAHKTCRSCTNVLLKCLLLILKIKKKYSCLSLNFR